MINYEKYWLSRIISVQAVVSADYIEGRFPAKYYHAHQSAWELIFALSGIVEVKKDGATVSLAQNQMILLSPGIHHDIQIDDPGAKIFVLSFACSNDSYLLSVQNIPLDAEASMIPFVESMIRELTATFAPQSTRLHLIRFVPDVHSPVGAEQMICCCLEQFLILLLRETTMTQGNVASAEQFHKAFQTHLTEQITDYIHENLSGQLTVQQIAEHLDIRPQSASEAIANMEQAGLVRRETDELDRRSSRIYITPEGQRQQAELLARRIENARRVLAPLTEEEKKTLLTLLEKVTDALQENKEEN